MRRTPLSALLAATIAVGLVAPSAMAAAPTVIEMRSLSYSPSSVEFAAPGGSVEWRNVTNPDRLHDAVSSLPDYFGSALLRSGQTYTFPFTAAGTFTFYCSIHDVMLGRVAVAPVVAVVTDASGSRLRIALGSASFAADAPYRWTVWLQGPTDMKLRYRRSTRGAVIEIPVAEAGAWTVMVRLRHVPTRTPSSDSPTVTVRVPG